MEKEERVLEESARQDSITPTRKPKRKYEPPSSKMQTTSRLTDDLKGKFNELLHSCQVARLMAFNLENVASIIRSVWGEEIKRYDWE